MESSRDYQRLQNPFSFKSWVEENKHLLKPPVGNKVIYKDSTFIVQVVGGPNQRTDFHVNQTDEIFYQVKGDVLLRIVNKKGEFEEVHVRQGDIFLLPGGIPHSPQRSENSIGIVIEKTRKPEDVDGLQWYCRKCGKKLYEEFFYLKNIETQFPEVFNRYYNSDHGNCSCGHQNGRVW